MNEIQIPSIIFERWMKVLRPNEFKILMMLLFECEERLSTKQKIADIMAFTGIRSHETIFKSVNRLERLDVIDVKETISWGRIYSLNWTAIFNGPPAWSGLNYIPAIIARDAGGY